MSTFDLKPDDNGPVSTVAREIPSSLRFCDPLEILLAEEQKTCKGCTHSHTQRVWGTKVTICMKRRNHGKRCKLYNNPTEEARA